MAASLEKIAEGTGALGKEIVYNVTFDTSFLAAGEIVDISDEFSEIITASCDYSDAVGDNSIKYDIVGPVDGTAVSSTNVLIVGHWGNDATGALTVVPDTTNNSTTGSLRVHVIGKPLNPSNFPSL